MEILLLNLWAIQNDTNEIYEALAQITSDDVIIYKNVVSTLKINNKLVKDCQFETIIYSEQSNAAILLSRDGMINSEFAEKYFDKHNIKYNIVNFIELRKIYKRDKQAKPFYFVHDSNMLFKAVKDSVFKGYTSCEYDPRIKSSLIFKYKLKGKPGKHCPFMAIKFRGLIEFEDKYIMPTIAEQRRNLHQDDIIELMKDLQIDINMVNASDEFHFKDI